MYITEKSELLFYKIVLQVGNNNVQLNTSCVLYYPTLKKKNQKTTTAFHEIHLATPKQVCF